jgi:tetratricopeptide (TPR) repeat protein/DNA-binding XRE family transcriptional regulator
MTKPIRLHPHLPTLRPNARLKAARERRRWSQQELADQLHITANSVSRWERGISSPGPYFRRQLCDLFGLSAQELGLLAGKQEETAHQTDQASRVARSSLPTICTLPFQRNPFFTGREEVLAQLHQRLQAGKQQTSFPQALCGLAGVGKTQTAIEYGYRFADEYQALLWLRAETQETLLADCRALAALLDLPQHQPQQVMQAVRQWLGEQRDWLLILDNIEDLALIQQVVPAIHQGHLLLTTRAQATGTLAQNIPLKKMDLQESALFLLRRTKHLPPDATFSQAAPIEQESAREIARLLDGLPLALDQAGAYIEETACRLPDYLDRYQSRRAALLTRRGSISSGHPASVSATLSLAIEQVEYLNPMAADLLRLCAFLQPDAIPEAIIVEGAAIEGFILELLARDACAFDAAIKTLRDYSLIQRQTESKTLSLHRLVQAVVQDRLDEQTHHQWAEHTVVLMSHAFPDSGEEVNWSRCQQYLPQALACAALIEEERIMIPEAGTLLWRTGSHLMESTRYAQAEEMLLRAQAILLLTVGELHANYAYCLNALGILYHYWGRYEEAGRLYQQSLRLCEQIFGPEHLTISDSLNNAGGLFYEQGQYEQAEASFLRALRIREKLLGAEDPTIDTPLNNLACLYADRGKYAQAESMLLRVIALREKLLGLEHPNTLSSLSHLAKLYAARKQYAQAEELHHKVLSLREQHLGTEHAHVGTSLHYLGCLYHELGRYEQAEDHYRRALAIRGRALGTEHPRTAEIVNDLARLLLEQGQIEAGEELCLCALAIQEQALRTAHPNYANCLTTQALLCEQRGDASRASQLYQQALRICEGVLMPEHPLVIRCQAACTRLLKKEEALEAAAEASEQPGMSASE